MHTSPFLLRNYRPEDFSGLDFMMQSAKTSIPLELQLVRPGFIPEKDLFLAFDKKNNPIGFTFVAVEKHIARTTIEIYVMPGNRGGGTGGSLLAKALNRSQEHETAVAQIEVQSERDEAGKFLSRRGFIQARSYLNLEKSLLEYKPEPAVGPELSFTNFKQGKEEELAELQNRIFASSWGYCPNSVPEIVFYLQATECRLEDIILINFRRQTVGYLWPQIKSELGRVHMCGVLPEFRGKGMGRILLFKALKNFWEAGTRIVSLTVDEQNTAAVSLYTTLGFVLRGRQIWWEKVLNPQG